MKIDNNGCFNHRLKNCILIWFLLFLIQSTLVMAATFQSNATGNWNAAGSWTFSGSDNDGIPDGNDDVEIINGDSISLAQNEACQSLTVTSGAVNVAGNTLTVSGNVQLDDTFDASAGGTLIIGSDFTLNSGASFNPSGTSLSLTFDANSGTQTATGTFSGSIDIDNLNKTNGSTLDWNLPINVQISGSLNLSGGTFQAGSATYTLLSSGTVFSQSGGNTFTAETSTFEFSLGIIGSQTISSDVSLAFYNITHNPGATRTLNFSGSGATRTFTINNRFTRSNKSDNITLSSAEIDYAAGAVLRYAFSENIREAVAAEWPSTSAGTTPPTVVDFNTGASLAANDAFSVDSLIIDGGGIFNINSGAQVTVDSLLEIQDGAVGVSGTLTYSDGSILKYNAGSTYSVGDEWSATLSPKNVQVTGAGADLTTNHSGTPLAVGVSGGQASDGDITFNSTLAHNSILEVRGDVTGLGGNFGVADNGELRLLGTENSSVTLNQQFTVRNLTVNKQTSGTATVTDGSTLKMDGSSGTSVLRVQSGTLTFDLNAALTLFSTTDPHTLQVDDGAILQTGGKDITGFDTYTLATNSTVEFNGDGAETMPAATYGTIDVNNTASTNDVILGGNITLQNGADFNIQDGTLNLGGNTITLSGSNDLLVASGAVLRTSNAAGDVAPTDITGFANYSISGDLVFNGNSGDEVLPAGVDGQAFNLQVNKIAGNLTTASATTIGGAGNSLTLSNGLVDVSGGSLILAAGTAVSGGDGGSHVDGTVSRVFDSSVEAGTTERILPIGEGGNYRPVRLDFAGLSGSITVTATQTETGPTGSLPSGVTAFASDVNRYWTLTSSGGGTFTNANVDLDHTDATDTQTNLRIISGTNGSGYTTIGSNTSYPTGSRIEAEFASFSDFALARTSVVAEWDGGGGNTLWSNASNWVGDAVPQSGDQILLDNNTVAGSFTVEYDGSTSETQFESIAIRPGSGNSIRLILTKSTTLDLTGTTTSLDLDDVNGGNPILQLNGTQIGMNGGGYDATKTAFDNGSEAEYSGGSDVYADTYGDLTVSKSSGTITASGDVTVNSDFSKSNSSDFTISDATLAVSGSLSLNGGTLTTSGSGALSVTGSTTNSASITLSGSGTTTFTGAYSGSGTLSATSSSPDVAFNSTFTPGGNATFGSQTLTLSGNVNVTGGTFTPSTNTSFTGSDFQVSGSGSVSSVAGGVAFEAGSGQTITGAVTFNNLTLNNSGSGVTINSGNPTVDGTLTLTDGILSTGSNDIILGSTASVSGGSSASYVNGNVGNTFGSVAAIKIYPLGTGGKYRQVKLEANTGSGSAVLTGSIVNQDATNITGTLGGTLESVSALRYYQFNNSSNALTVAQIHGFRVNDDDGVGSFTSNTTLRLASTVGSGGTWNERDLQSDPNTTSLPVDITSTTFTESVGASETVYVTLATSSSSDNALPVELVSFTAVTDYGKLILEWSTASEINNEGFFIYRSQNQNGPFLQRVNHAMIPGQGNTNTSTQYEFVDKNVEAEVTYYYKLQSRDFDGTVHDYGKVVSASVLKLPERFELAQNFPNPFNPSTNIKFSIAQPARVSLVIYDVLGRKIKTIFQDHRFEPGVYTDYSWDARNATNQKVSNGIYYLVMSVDEFNLQEVRKMIYIR